MIKKQSLPHIISLLDDDSDEIRNHVFNDLVGYGLNLEQDLVEFSDILDRNNLTQLKPIIESNRRKWLLENWASWKSGESETKKIEIAMNIISKYQLGVLQTTHLSTKLNIVAGDFMNLYPYGNELDLSYYLFHILDLHGSKEDYYNPLNCNLYSAIENGIEIPLTLVLIFIFVAERLGLNVTGCNFPGHFLAKIDVDGEMLLIDCFDRGRIIFPSDIDDLSEESFNALLTIINSPISARKIIRRMLTNLTSAYKKNGEKDKEQFFKELILLNGVL